jgi:ElaB/YqjD/DUF883 family membrane-anchored ribosome-binding protein
MVETLLEEVHEHIVESSNHIDQAKTALNDACEDFVDKSRRVAKAGRRAAEDLVDQAEHTVKKHPKSAVASVMMTGFILGFCLGCLLARRD